MRPAKPCISQPSKAVLTARTPGSRFRPREPMAMTWNYRHPHLKLPLQAPALMVKPPQLSHGSLSALVLLVLVWAAPRSRVPVRSEVARCLFNRFPGEEHRD